jgi:hypothetical protein
MATSLQEQAFNEIHDEALRLLGAIENQNSDLYRGLEKIVSLSRYKGGWVEHPEQIQSADE